jgi:hypothetical protein
MRSSPHWLALKATSAKPVLRFTLQCVMLLIGLKENLVGAYLGQNDEHFQYRHKAVSMSTANRTQCVKTPFVAVSHR